MTRAEVEHVLRAAAGVTDENVFLVLGSQAVHGSIEFPPYQLTKSRELDIFPMKAPEKMDLINGAIGEISQFDATFGYYAHGMPPEACPLPKDWDKRLQPIQNASTKGALGLCLSVPDLACSKLAAGREKDLGFVVELIVHGFCSTLQINQLIPQLPREDHRKNAELNWKIVASRAHRYPACAPMIRAEIQLEIDRLHSLPEVRSFGAEAQHKRIELEPEL